MKAVRTIFFIGVGCVALGVLVYLGHAGISMHAVPSLSEYVASNTRPDDQSASSTASAWMASSTIVRMLLSTTATSTPSAFTATSSGQTIPSAIGVPRVPKIASTLSVRSTLPEGYIKAPKGKIRLLIAKTPNTRERGLGGYASLDTDQGMLFIFPRPTSVNFWMEDMKFSLDFVWMSSDHTIVGITSNISPDTYPASFPSPGKVQFVLELNAGAATQFGLKVGDRLAF